MRARTLCGRCDGELVFSQRSFREYDCFPLPRPVDSEQQLQEVDTMEFSALKNNFQEVLYSNVYSPICHHHIMDMVCAICWGLSFFINSVRASEMVSVNLCMIENRRL